MFMAKIKTAAARRSQPTVIALAEGAKGRKRTD
jgi:hypothetical protein